MRLYLCCEPGIEVDQVLMVEFAHIDDHRRCFPVAHDCTLISHELRAASLLVLHTLLIIGSNMTSLNALVNNVLSLFVGSALTQ